MSALPQQLSSRSMSFRSRAAGRPPTFDTVEVVCECGHPGCTAEIVMSLREYEAVRRFPTRFVIKEGHEVSESHHVVDQAEDYVVVARDAETTFGAFERRGEKLAADLEARVAERARDAISARLGTPPDVAFEMLCGLAHSQGRELHEYAAAVVAKGGRLDA
jgi:hypothetical protein